MNATYLDPRAVVRSGDGRRAHEAVREGLSAVGIGASWCAEGHAVGFRVRYELCRRRIADISSIGAMTHAGHTAGSVRQKQGEILLAVDVHRRRGRRIARRLRGRPRIHV